MGLIAGYVLLVGKTHVIFQETLYRSLIAHEKLLVINSVSHLTIRFESNNNAFALQNQY